MGTSIASHAGRVRRSCGRLAVLAAAFGLASCDDPTSAPIPELVVVASTDEFAEADVAVGTDEMIVVEIMNDGGGELTVSEVTLEGSDASDFQVGAPGTLVLGPGGSTTIDVAFVPASVGDKTATVALRTNDPDNPRVEIAVRGRAAQFQYTQVDRVGIPGLNTVFNHPSGIAGFDKTAYNTVTPAGDVATYASQFETVLGAVGNADPAGTAALLLPDELPVALGATTTAFAQLTGRALSDDAVDVALTVTVGISSLQSDNVDANDKAFPGTFPYVAAPHS